MVRLLHEMALGCRVYEVAMGVCVPKYNDEPFLRLKSDRGVQIEHVL